MGKISKLLVCGHAGVGKTAAIEQLIYGNHVVGTMYPTIEDIYSAMIETDRGVKEKVIIYDTGSLDENKSELPRHYFSFPDGFVLFYDVTNMESFHKLDRIKKDIDRFKDKREVHIAVIGNKVDLQEGREVDKEKATVWAQREKVKLFEATVSQRKAIIDPFVWITSRITQPQTKGKYVAAQQKRLTTLQMSLRDLPGKSAFLSGRKGKGANVNTD
ncbi:NF-kappa-B inhibitor-interacting Ras-like protein 1 isoform X2 [Saccostrea echinata]|uniref:NF-kappa-B inhibitor-interacting Ras-like protein 1 isoform X2 n=1 Tax=Saccostrea echinata TaxID=191078 RepID=UPI002A7F8915|nr:NF-kappa-B inhibitor-interacting Ras-like protein 1 isoform X2 [Saccostrea echinata]